MLNDLKARAAIRAAEFVKDGHIVGLGSGTTAEYMIRNLGEKVQSGLYIRGVATSKESESLARQLGIPLLQLNEAGRIDITIDGADQVDSSFNLIKGGGGAHTREKLVA